MLNSFQPDHTYIACGYTDLRRGIDGLAEIVQEQFKQYGAEDIKAVKNGTDLKLQITSGSEVLGTMNIAGYFDSNKQGLYGTIELKTNDSGLLKLNQINNIVEEIVINASEYAGSKDIATEYQSNIKLYGGEGYTVNASAYDDVIEIGNENISEAKSHIINAGAGNDNITINGGNGHEIYGEAGDDTISVSNTNNVKLSGGAGTDTYNIEWKLGDTIVIDNTNVDGQADNFVINGEGVTKDSFIYLFDGNTNTLIMTDDNEGTLSIQLSECNNDLGYNIPS